MSRYLYNANYYWEVVVDSRSPEVGFSVYLEERKTTRRKFLRHLAQRREMEAFCMEVQKDLYLTEEDFEKKYDLRLTSPPAPEQPDKTDVSQVA